MEQFYLAHQREETFAAGFGAMCSNSPRDNDVLLLQPTETGDRYVEQWVVREQNLTATVFLER